MNIKDKYVHITFLEIRIRLFNTSHYTMEIDFTRRVGSEGEEGEEGGGVLRYRGQKRGGEQG